MAKLDLERVKRELASEKKTATIVCDAKVTAADAKRAACMRDLERHGKLVTKALDKCARPTPWYKAPQLHFVLGGIVSGGVCAAASRIK